MSDQKGDITRLLLEAQAGDGGALDRLMPAVYDELRRIARGYLRREASSHTLQPTALVHEAYLRLVDQRAVQWQNRAHFFGIAARMMRRILVDHARARAAEKRGSDRTVVELDEALDAAHQRPVDLIRLDDALQTLADLDPEKSRIVELRYFGGLTAEEIAEVTSSSTATVTRQWRLARAWLFGELDRTGS